jgi:mono/diheme cytochrome c family protein
MRIGYDVNSISFPSHQYRMSFLRLTFVAFLLLAVAACAPERRKTDAELGLDPKQARGRHIFDAKCARCHDPYNSSARKGPSLTKLYRHQYLPSGLPATDEHVTDSIVMGRKMMPAFNDAFTPQQLQDLLAYMKTL